MKRIVLAGAVLAAAAATAGLAVPAGASPVPGPSTSGTEYFHMVSTSSTSNTRSVIVTGLFTAGGIDHEGGNTDTLVFPRGTFTVKVSAPTGTQIFNQQTCLLTVSQHATITVSGGTGAYRGISGSGKAQLTGLAVAARSSGKCSQTETPAAFQQIITASVPVRL
jgi:hypothetical protein